MNYFDHPFLSNSKLTKFGQEIGILSNYIKGDPSEYYRMGTLFDLLVTEPVRIDRLSMTMVGTDYSFTRDELYQNEKMRESLLSNKTYQSILTLNPSFQHEVYNDVFVFDNLPPTPFKAKLDILIPQWVIDLKTTQCTSQRSFVESCGMFGYYRQMLLYMMLTGSKMATIIGVSKNAPHKVFIESFNNSHSAYEETFDMIKLLLTKYQILN